MNGDTISVIITVCNRESYIRKCIDSVIDQKNVNLEIIIIDDGSTDSSGDICDEYALNHENIAVIHKTNEGISIARNVGLDNVHGDYIYFVDDDYLPDNALETLLQLSKEKNADMVFGNYAQYTDDGVYDNCFLIPKKYCNKLLSKREMCELLLFDEKSHLAVVNWGKLYRKHVWDNVRFTDYALKSVDQFVFPLWVDNCDRIYFTDRILYNQTLSEKSITRSVVSRKRLYHPEGVLGVIEYLLKLEFYDLALYKFGDGTRHIMYFRKLLKDQESVKVIRKLYADYCSIAKKMIPNVDFKNKLRLLLFIFNLDLYEIVQKSHSKKFYKRKKRK